MVIVTELNTEKPFLVRSVNNYLSKTVTFYLTLTQIITRMCEHGKFNGAKSIEGKSGQWLIPKENFVTTNEQDDIAEKILQTIDIKNKEAGDVDKFDL